MMNNEYTNTNNTATISIGLLSELMADREKVRIIRHYLETAGYMSTSDLFAVLGLEEKKKEDA